MKEKVCHCGKHQHELCARRVPIFKNLNEEELKHVVSLIVQKEYPKGSLIFSEGDLLPNLFIVNRGRVKTFLYTSDGREQIFYILSEGDFLGERNLLQSKEAIFNAEALENTLVCMIAKHDFQQLLLKYPYIGFKIMEELCNRLEKMETLVKNISPKDTDARINMMLLEFSKKYGREHDGGTLIELPLSREQMANYIGVARETVSRKLTALKEEGIIKFIGNKTILLLDEKALQESI